MSGASLQYKEADGVIRSYDSDGILQTEHFVPRSAVFSPPSTSGELHHSRADAASWKAARPAAGRQVPLPCNLDRFLEATTPRVSAQYLPKRMSDWSPCEEERSSYFKLGDLWESFKEWSAYGAGVPLVLNGRDSVVQYYVPFLSGIQLYADSSTHSSSPRISVEDSDVDSFKDSSSDVSSDYEIEGRFKSTDNWCKNCTTSQCMNGRDKLFLNERHTSMSDEFYSDDSDGGDSQGSLIFEYLEYDHPYCRVPLADKIADLAKQFPVLKSVKSCDLLPASWFSVAWYPIYRIPTGRTLRDLDTCFLTFHRLSTSMKGSTCERSINKLCGVYGVPKISLPVFGLASYKLKSSIWTSNSNCDGKHANILLEAADKWLRLLNANLPDYHFFASQNKFRR
ncbi:hypothetical protein KSP40_PGU021440 [Platanthera guangdongensis]|uniref:Uncharacterized protein n=1 Tax=Platanthera guangdongensis TaxID=2320717 RepID=A0ABR2M599_9ASPA